MLLDESFFDTLPTEVRYNQYVVIDGFGTLGESYLGTYASEIEAYKMYKKASSKYKRIFKANVTFVKIGNRNYMKSYEEI
ncbi:hypothetical protein [Clostridium isatidis]|uniref:Uncharacterized protein n=1 Tax=Clostridium isatidis TaxID=182773 RepID=A0A343JBE4_9CLOT|nr:hypothetical protein [Clostridium isatidis]ASW42852.1 hypothetical protein BEN51_05020 [Clostridium isatidis]